MIFRLAAMFVVLGAMAPGAARAYMRDRGPMPPVGGSAQGPVSAADIAITENLGQRVPRGLVFSDGHGGQVALDRLLARGLPLVVTLGYYHCPMLCSLVHEGLAKGLSRSRLAPGRDYVGIAVSIDPREDPRSANTQAGRLLRALGHQERGDWPFVLDPMPGAPSARALADAVGFRYKYDPASKQFAHSAVAFVLAPDGKISRYLYGVDFPPRDLRFALVEAGGGRVGTSLDRVLLSCFKYDPQLQRYTPYLIAFVRIGAGLSFMALVALLAVLWRREALLRRRKPA